MMGQLQWLRTHSRLRSDFRVEICLRLVLFILFKISDDAVPFRRKIQPEEVWLYKFPRHHSIIPSETLHMLNFVLSVFIIWAIFKFHRKVNDATNALLGVSLSTYLSITITNIIKLAVGRPRPDFFERCFSNPPEDALTLSQALCDRPEEDVNQGYKSFPSGHSTMAFGCMGYLSFYIAWSLRVFSQPNLSYPCFRLCAFLAPLLCAAMIAVSRTCDYHHHWQDTSVGSLIGLSVAYMCYRQSFCGLTAQRSDSAHPLSPPPVSDETLVSIQSY